MALTFAPAQTLLAGARKTRKSQTSAASSSPSWTGRRADEADEHDSRVMRSEAEHCSSWSVHGQSPQGTPTWSKCQDSRSQLTSNFIKSSLQLSTTKEKHS